MRFEIDTDFLVCPNTYSTGIQQFVDEDYWEETKNIMVTQAKKFLKKYLAFTDFKDAIFQLSELKSPNDYCYGVDWIDMTLDFEESVLITIKSKVTDAFFTWIRETYHSRDGWASFFPITKAEWFAAIDKPLERSQWRMDDKELAVIEYLTWQINSQFDPEKIQDDYIAACWREIQANGYECKEEEYA